jgi:hypothetical protein
MEKGFDNGGVKRRLSLVNLGTFESSWGKGLLERWILGSWSRHISFMKGSSIKGKGTSLKWSSQGSYG